MEIGSGARLVALVLCVLLSACADEKRAPGEFEAHATGGVNEPSLTGSAVAWLNIAGGQRYFEIRLHTADDASRHIVLTTMQQDWPAEGIYQVTENAPTGQTFDLLLTLGPNRLVRGTSGTLEIIESGSGELAGRFDVQGAFIDLSSPGASMPTVHLEGTFHATCSEQSGQTGC